MLQVIRIALACSSTALASADTPPGIEAGQGTHWIWSGSSREKGSVIHVRKRFSTSAETELAMLRCRADFSNAVVMLGGARVARARPYDQPARIDVTRHLRSGENLLVIRATGTGGPAAVALELVITSTDGTSRVIRSDPFWESADVSRSGSIRSSIRSSITSHGRVDREPWWNVERPSTDVFDEYNQWEEALGSGESGDPARFQALSGFRVELVRSAREDEGSWVSLLVDPRGRLIVGKEKRGLLRITLAASEDRKDGKDRKDGNPTVEVIDDDLQGCHGLLWAYGSLYANANESKTLFRLRDTDGDDRFDEVRPLKKVPGGAGDHGRHDLALGPDGGLYVIHGDAARLPDEFQSRVPPIREFGRERRPLKGLFVRTDPDGTTWEVVASGLRNPFGIDFNQDGEAFTYDADHESDQGMPWYRPTRIHHLVSGADYGYRGGDRKWPPYYPETLPSNVDIGKGSPTAVKFGTRSSFPPRYRRALFALDWTYGRVLAVHLVPRGASYSGHAETFLRGRPLNVTDLDFAPDGSMFLITGGYKTRSALYRVRYVGPAVTERRPTPQEEARDAYSRQLRPLRRRLKSLHRPGAPGGVATAWPFLDHPDPWIRHAARVAIEHQPVTEWGSRALAEARVERALPALLALVRVGRDSDLEATHGKLRQISLGDLSTHLKLVAVRVAFLAHRHGKSSAAHRARVLDAFEPLYPSHEGPLDRELCRLLASHGSREVVENTLRILATAETQEDTLHYLLMIAEVREGWSPQRRTEYFRLLRSARLFQGDKTMAQVVPELEKDARRAAPASERARLSRLLAAGSAGPDTPADSRRLERPFVRKWTLADVEKARAADGGRDHDLEKGKVLFSEALCGRCHRLGTVGRAFGPDLTAVSARFGRRDLLEAILSPSKVVSEKYRNHVLVTRDGRVVTGQVVRNEFRKSLLHVATDPMNLEVVTKISKRDLVSHEESAVSPMPEGLLDTLTREEILDLLAYVESGGRVGR